jgi:hypothetical protein
MPWLPDTTSNDDPSSHGDCAVQPGWSWRADVSQSAIEARQSGAVSPLGEASWKHAARARGAHTWSLSFDLARWRSQVASVVTHFP